MKDIDVFFGRSNVDESSGGVGDSDQKDCREGEGRDDQLKK